MTQSKIVSFPSYKHAGSFHRFWYMFTVFMVSPKKSKQWWLFWVNNRTMVIQWDISMENRLLGIIGIYMACWKIHQWSMVYPRASERFGKSPYFSYPIGSMYAIYGNIYHQYTPNVSIYTIHGSYGVNQLSIAIFNIAMMLVYQRVLEILLTHGWVDQSCASRPQDLELFTRLWFSPKNSPINVAIGNPLEIEVFWWS
jgi:hypothetical protein